MKALLLTQHDKQTIAAITTLSDDELPEGNVTIQVAYSSLNYKDGLAIAGVGKIVSEFPMVPGIDCAGTVLEDSSGKFSAGDKVISTGWGVGERHWGGMAEKARLNADWLVPMPDHCDEVKAMKIGTAGLTAMLCVNALEEGGVKPGQGPVLVTGASGGVGSVALTLLSQLGYEVVAASGRKAENEALLKSLGASDIVERKDLDREARPLEKQQWAGLIDTVGNKVLATALAQLHYGGTAAICGLAGGFALPTTVMPFILRGVRLQGIDCVMLPQPQRETAWRRVIDLLPASYYEQASEVISLELAPEYAQKIIAGQVTGRVLIKI